MENLKNYNNFVNEEYGDRNPELTEISDRLEQGEDIDDLVRDCINRGLYNGLYFLVNVNKRDKDTGHYLRVNLPKALKVVRSSNIDDDIKNKMIELLNNPRTLKYNKKISGW